MKKTIYILFFFCLVSRLSISQSLAADSLKSILKNAKHDTIRCSVLNALFEISDKEERTSYNDELKMICEKNLNQAVPPALKNVFKKFMGNCLNNYGTHALAGNEYDKAIDFFSRALKFSEEAGDQMGISNSYNNTGLAYQSLGEMEKALDYGKKALEIQKKINDVEGMAVSYINIGNIHKYHGEINEALVFYSNGLKLYEKRNDKSGIATTLNNMAVIVKLEGDKERALELYQRALGISQELNDVEGIARALSNMGVIYKNKNEFDKALECYTKALKIREETHNHSGEAATLNNLGSLYQQQDLLPKALECYQKCLAIRQEIHDKKGLPIAFRNIASVYCRMNKLNEALVFAKKGMEISKEMGFAEQISLSAQVMTEIYKKQNKPEQALQMFELYIQMRDSVANEETKKASVKTQLKYEYEKRAAADSVKNAEEQKVKDAQLTAQTASLKQEKFQRYSLVVGLLIVLGGLGFVINRFRVTSKQKKIIEQQKIVVDQAFEKLHEKNKEVMDSIYYARRIQRALITSEKYIDRILKNKIK